METGRVPRDDRAWPRGAAVISIALFLVSIGAAAWLIGDSGDRGAGYVLVLLASLGITSGAGFVGNAAAVRRWVRGHSYRGQDALWGALAAGLAIAIFYFDPALGGVIFAGMMGGGVLANLWVMRAARANREVVDAAEAEFARQRAAEHEGPELAREDVAATDSVAVGQALRQAAVEDARRLIAWLIAGVVTLLVLAGSGAPFDTALVIGMGSLLATAWVARRLWGIWLAIWDHRRAATLPRRAFVVVIPGLNPKSLRPLLAVWSEPPHPRGGRLPVPDHVYVCDGERDALRSSGGSPIVHEAWVDTGSRSWFKPRWVVADAGLVVPHRRSLFGRWQVAFLLNSARPESPSPLTVPVPNPDRENARPVRSPTKFAIALAWRLGVLFGLWLLITVVF